MDTNADGQENLMICQEESLELDKKNPIKLESYPMLPAINVASMPHCLTFYRCPNDHSFDGEILPSDSSRNNNSSSSNSNSLVKVKVKVKVKALV